MRPRFSFLSLSILLTWLLASSPGLTQVFTDVTATALPEIGSPPLPGFKGGVALGDCDGDGLPDLYFNGFRRGTLYRNRGDGSFENITARSNLGESLITHSAAFGDIDNDGDLDLYVTGAGESRHFLYVNDGTCTFTEQALERGTAAAGDSPRIGRGVSFGDYNRDGYLDIFVAELQSNLYNPDATRPIGHLFRNRGASAPGFFDDVTASAGLLLEAVHGSQDGTFLFAARFTDFDHDGWPDIALSSDFHESRLYWNDGDGHFSDGTLAAGVGTDEHGMGITTADLDGDGRFDIFITSIFVDGNPKATGNRLFHNNDDRTFSDVTDAAGVRNGMWGWGTEAFDYDNDGDLDLIMTNGDFNPSDPFHQAELGSIDYSQFATDPLRFWRNDGTGVFTEISAAAGIFDDGVGQGVLPFDYDGDGNLDVLVTHDGGVLPRLFRNDGGNQNAWIDIELEGRSAQRNGIGAVITVRPAGGKVMVREVSASSTYAAQDGTGRVHFGLGTSPAAVDNVRIQWLSGPVQTVVNPPINAVLRIRQEPAPQTPTPTLTASPPTPTMTIPLSCVGDCNRDGYVTIDELITGVNLVIFGSGSSNCWSSSAHGSSRMTIDLLIRAVGFALTTCPA